MHKNNLAKITLIMLALLLTVACILLVLEKSQVINLYQKPNNTVEITKINNTNLATKKTETESKKIDIPASVNPDSIKNYQLITENEEYKIRKLGDEYTITLYAILNRPDQYENYKDQLKQFKSNAQNFLISSGIDVTKVKIIYEPNEASNL